MENHVNTNTFNKKEGVESMFKKGSFIFIGLLSSALFLTGCSTTQNQATNNSSKSTQSSTVTTKSQTTETTQSNNKVQGFVFHNPGVVIFIKFTNENGSINGTMYERSEDQNNQLKIFNTGITGSVTGSNITLNLTESGNSYTGTLSRNELDIAVPASDGTMMTDTFKIGTLNDFNTFVDQLNNTISSDQQQQAQAQQNQTLTNQLNSVESDINNLVQAIPNDEQSLQGDLSTTGNDIDTEKKDLATVQKDEQHVMSEKSGDDQTGSDADQVGSDSDQVSSDDNQISSDNDQVQTDENTLQSDISSLDSDFQKMTELASQLNTTLPDSLPTQSDITSMDNKSQNALASATKTMNSYTSESKQMVNTANSLADKANKHANG